MLTDIIRDMLVHAEIGTGDTVLVLEGDPIIVGAPRAEARCEAVAYDDLSSHLERLDTTNVMLAAQRAISPFEASLERQQLSGWISEAHNSALDEGGTGLLMGFDPTDPERRLAAADVVVGEEEVLLDGATLFRWSDVARASACRGSETAFYILVDGRSVFLHADVDWDNRLS